MTKTLLIFPGQGAQYRGMGHDLFKDHDAVRHTYEEANDILGYNIADTSFLDPENKLMLTRYTQPALLTHSVSCLRLFAKQVGEHFQPDAAAGHSLGEYSALVAAGSLDFSTALELVQKRGELMGKFGQGEMEALPVPRETAQALASKHYCGVAACNLPEQTVVGGLPDDLERLVDDLKELDPKKNSTRLKTEGAFHTYFMVEGSKTISTSVGGRRSSGAIYRGIVELFRCVSRSRTSLYPGETLPAAISSRAVVSKSCTGCSLRYR